MEKQQNVKKKRPRGRPFKPGESGNPAGRPRGSRHKLTMAVLESLGGAEAELSEPLRLDKNLPFEVWSDRYVQAGRIFNKGTLLEKSPSVPPTPQPKTLNPRKPRQEIVWGKKHFYIQDGYPFDRHTRKAVKI